jgi:hypothetical protein
VLLIIGAVAVVALLLVAAFVILRRGSNDVGEGRTTVVLERRDITEFEEFQGSLGYGESRPSPNLMASAPSVVTELAPEGQIIAAGGVIYRIDNLPVVLLYGATPAWRTMEVGTAGQDVLQLKESLIAMQLPGSESIEVNDTYDATTASVVEEMERQAGSPSPDGVVELGSAVFFPGTVRVSQYVTQLGSVASPGSPVVLITLGRQVAIVDLPAARQEIAVVGDPAEVELPDGTVVTGSVKEVSRTASRPIGQPDADPTIPVTIGFADDVELPGLDQAPVTVGLSSQSATEVLAVPITALVGLSEGGYGIEIVDGSNDTRFIAVEIGVYGSQYVEVISDELTEGLQVVVPS